MALTTNVNANAITEREKFQTTWDGLLERVDVLYGIVDSIAEVFGIRSLSVLLASVLPRFVHVYHLFGRYSMRRPRSVSS